MGYGKPTQEIAFWAKDEEVQNGKGKAHAVTKATSDHPWPITRCGQTIWGCSAVLALTEDEKCKRCVELVQRDDDIDGGL
jgi:hypothetical protein